MKRNFKTLSLSLFVLVIAFTLIISTGNIPPVQANTTNLGKQVDAYLTNLSNQDKFSGTALVASHGQILLKKGYGMANRELSVPNTPINKFRIGSNTKAFTAMSIMILKEQNKLKVTDHISKYISNYPNGSKITIKHLLTHTSGIAEYTTDDFFISGKARLNNSVTTIINMFKNKPMSFKPGTKFEYCNSNYVLLGAIIEKVSGKSYADFVNENIFTPLNMNDTGYSFNEEIVPNRVSGYYASENGDIVNSEYIDISAAYSAGGLHSTVEDLYKWDRALYTRTLVSQVSLDEMFTPVKEGFGYGWIIQNENNHKIIWHCGEIPGFTSLVKRYVDDDTCIIILSNNEDFDPEQAVQAFTLQQ